MLIKKRFISLFFLNQLKRVLCLTTHNTMKANTSFPAGYKVASQADRARLGKREINATVTLAVNETLHIDDLICKETQYKDDNGDNIVAYRLACSSSEKPRILPLATFNPFPKERIEFMQKSKFFRDVLDFSGSYNEFVDWLLGLGKDLKVISAERLAFRPYGKDEDSTKIFYLIDYAD